MAEKSAKKPWKEPVIGGRLDKIAPWALLVGIVLAVAGFIINFTVAPLVNGAEVDGVAVINGVVVSNMLLISQKIFYWHMPLAVVSAGALLFTLYYGIRFLMTKKACYDARAKVCTEVALVFILCTMATGVAWERYEWGVWWTWEPRLTTYFILMLLVFAYFILRNAVDDPERRATFASVFGILLFVDVPICFAITRLVPSSLHPVIFRTDSGLSTEMMIPLMLSMFGFLLVGFAMVRLRLRVQVMEDKLVRIQDAADEKLAAAYVPVAPAAAAAPAASAAEAPEAAAPAPSEGASPVEDAAPDETSDASATSDDAAPTA